MSEVDHGGSYCSCNHARAGNATKKHSSSREDTKYRTSSVRREREVDGTAKPNRFRCMPVFPEGLSSSETVTSTRCSSGPCEWAFLPGVSKPDSEAKVTRSKLRLSRRGRDCTSLCSCLASLK